MNIEDITSPLPWRVREDPLDEYRFAIVDASDGMSVATVWNKADVARVVDAVNERDAMRDLVRRLSDRLERYHVLGPPDRALISEAGKLLGKARRKNEASSTAKQGESKT